MRFFFYCLFILFFLCSASYAETGLSLKNEETLTIDNDRLITGDIELTGNAVLTIKNANVVVLHSAGDPREDILLSDNAKLILENAALIPSIFSPDNLYLSAAGNSKIEITNSTIINVLDLAQNASIIGKNARIYSGGEPLNIPETDGAFGIVQVSDNAIAEFTDSIIGSLGIFLPEGSEASFSNLKPQEYNDFNLQRDSQVMAGFNIILKNSNVLPVKLEKGPFERGWTIFTDSKAKLQVKDSSLNKLVLQAFRNEEVTLHDLMLGTPITFDFKDIHLTNTTITNQWGIQGENCNVIIENSDGVWPWPIGLGTWKLINSRMNEFDPRRFDGELIFTNSIWEIAGEIFENTNMKIKGTVMFGNDIEQNLRVSDSLITREYSVKVLKRKKPVKSFSLEVFDKQNNITQAQTRTGEALVSLEFTPENYKEKLELKVNVNGKIKKKEIGFFTGTPIVVRY